MSTALARFTGALRGLLGGEEELLLEVGPHGPSGPIDVPNAGDGTWEVDYRIDSAGAYGITVRVLPRHDGLLTPVELGRAAWAN